MVVHGVQNQTGDLIMYKAADFRVNGAEVFSYHPEGRFCPSEPILRIRTRPPSATDAIPNMLPDLLEVFCFVNLHLPITSDCGHAKPPDLCCWT
jgi:hypothetical protein